MASCFAGTALGLFCAREMKRVVAQFIQPIELSNAGILSSWLVRECRKTGRNSVSRRRLSQYGPAGLSRVEACDDARNLLCEAGHVRFTQFGNATEIEVNPALILPKAAAGTAIQ